jgi:PIN domain nuclease of toxin-antitoxin system
MVNGDRRLSAEVRAAIGDKESSLHVSAVTAYEYPDLQQRGRIPVSETLDEVAERLDLAFGPYPAECSRIADGLPPIHRDPIDRMLTAHAMVEQWTLVTADANVRCYPVTTL